MSKAKSFTIRDLIRAQIFFAILIGIVFLIINPTKKIEEVKEKSKLSDISKLQTAIDNYSRDHKGQLPDTFPSFETTVEIKKNNGGVGDVCSYLVPEYLPELPVNPDLSLVPVKDCFHDYVTGYIITLDESGEVRVTTL